MAAAVVVFGPLRGLSGNGWKPLLLWPLFAWYVRARLLWPLFAWHVRARRLQPLFAWHVRARRLWPLFACRRV